MSGANLVTDSRKRASRLHAVRSHECLCGKICHGNGGWSSHKKACPIFQAARQARFAESPEAAR